MLNIIYFTPSSKRAVLYDRVENTTAHLGIAFMTNFKTHQKKKKKKTRINMTNSQLQWKDIPLGENWQIQSLFLHEKVKEIIRAKKLI